MKFGEILRGFGGFSLKRVVRISVDFGGKNVQILNKKLYNLEGFLAKMMDFWIKTCVNS